MSRQLKLKNKYKKALAGLFFLFLGFLCLPVLQFEAPYATVLSDRKHQLLGAHIAADEQWRFPPGDSVPLLYREAVLLFEDRHFYRHPGINPVALLRAAWWNWKHGRVVSGGSTISMQVVRLARPASRTLPNKLWEMLLALRLEAALSKDSILALYAAHAPYGGNTVGLEAASWRYFRHDPGHLTPAETALLAVLPNAPSLLHLAKGRDELLEKRNRLLQRLYENQALDEQEYFLALQEDLPPAPAPLPRLAPHLLDQQLKTARGTRRTSSIDAHLQQLAGEITERHSKRLQGNQIHNAAALIAAVESGEVLVYIGNSSGEGSEKGHQVDIIQSTRSPGSVLKPFLYALALQDGTLLPQSLLPDVPTYYRGFTPQNYQRGFDGAVPANEALARSLNIPFVRLLHDYDGDRFLRQLQDMGLHSLNKNYNHYGLSLILGGGESTLWELAGAYAAMVRTLNHYCEEEGRYRRGDFHPLSLSPHPSDRPAGPQSFQATHLRAGAIYSTLSALTSVERPPEEAGWEHFGSARQIAWKTGTSYGFRDAWGLGVSKDYVVAVWVGNASGEGRPGIVGGLAAGPLLFELFGLLPHSDRFPVPHDDMEKAPVCRESGFRAGPACPHDTLMVPRSVRPSKPCPYHQKVHLTADGRYRSNLSHEAPGQLQSHSFLVLPPIMEWYYRQKHPRHQVLPPWKPGTEQTDDRQPMDLIYPPARTRVLVPRNFDGSPSRIVARAVHRKSESRIHWYLNQQYLGSTYLVHEMEILPRTGTHTLILVDDEGKRLQRTFVSESE